MLSQVLAEGRSLHVGHDIEDEPLALAGVEQPRDVGMAQLGGDANFPKEPVGSDISDTNSSIGHVYPYENVR